MAGPSFSKSEQLKGQKALDLVAGPRGMGDIPMNAVLSLQTAAGNWAVQGASEDFVTQMRRHASQIKDKLPAELRKDFASTVDVAAQELKGVARDKVQETIGSVKGVATQITEVADTVMWLGSEYESVRNRVAESVGGKTGTTSNRVVRKLIDLTISTMPGMSLLPAAADAGQMAKRFDLVEKETGQASFTAPMSEKLNQWAEASQGALGATPRDPEMFSPMEKAEIVSSLESQAVLALVGAEEVKIVMNVIGPLGSLRGIVETVRRDKHWYMNAAFWTSVIGMGLSVVGLKHSLAAKKITAKILKYGSLTQAIIPMEKLALDYVDYLSTTPGSREYEEAEKLVKADWIQVLHVIKDAILHVTQARTGAKQAPTGSASIAQSSTSFPMEPASKSAPPRLVNGGQIEAPMSVKPTSSSTLTRAGRWDPFKGEYENWPQRVSEPRPSGPWLERAGETSPKSGIGLAISAPLPGSGQPSSVPRLQAVGVPAPSAGQQLGRPRLASGSQDQVPKGSAPTSESLTFFPMKSASDSAPPPSPRTLAQDTERVATNRNLPFGNKSWVTDPAFIPQGRGAGPTGSGAAEARLELHASRPPQSTSGVTIAEGEGWHFASPGKSGATTASEVKQAAGGRVVTIEMAPESGAAPGVKGAASSEAATPAHLSKGSDPIATHETPTNATSVSRASESIEAVSEAQPKPSYLSREGSTEAKARTRDLQNVLEAAQKERASAWLELKARKADAAKAEGDFKVARKLSREPNAKEASEVPGKSKGELLLEQAEKDLKKADQAKEEARKRWLSAKRNRTIAKTERNEAVAARKRIASLEEEVATHASQMDEIKLKNFTRQRDERVAERTQYKALTDEERKEFAARASQMPAIRDAKTRPPRANELEHLSYLSEKVPHDKKVEQIKDLRSGLYESMAKRVERCVPGAEAKPVALANAERFGLGKAKDGTPVDVATGKFMDHGEEWSVDHIMSRNEISRDPRFRLLTPAQQEEMLLGIPENYMPLKVSVNSVKKNKSVSKWIAAEGFPKEMKSALRKADEAAREAVEARFKKLLP